MCKSRFIRLLQIISVMMRKNDTCSFVSLYLIIKITTAHFFSCFCFIIIFFVCENFKYQQAYTNDWVILVNIVEDRKFSVIDSIKNSRDISTGVSHRPGTSPKLHIVYVLYITYLNLKSSCIVICWHNITCSLRPTLCIFVGNK